MSSSTTNPAPAAPLNGLQIALKTASAIATLFPAFSLASIPLSMLADHEPELAKLIPNFNDIKHVTLAELKAQEDARIMSANPLNDTHL